MLSMLHKKAYQEFMTLLNEWQKICESWGNNPINESLDVSEPVINQESAISKQFPKLQRYFEREITTLTDDKLDIKVVSFWRSLHTEIQREFRLLSTDMLFLASSRQTSTREKRLQTICDRNTKLIAYCQKILDI